MRYLTNGRRKYIWWALTGREQLLDLSADPQELHDLIGERSAAAGLERRHSGPIELPARHRLGFSTGTRLLPTGDCHGPRD